MRRLAIILVGLAFFGFGPAVPTPLQSAADMLPLMRPIHESDCRNVVFMFDGFRVATTGASMAGVPERPGWRKELIAYDDAIVGVVQPHTLDETVAQAVPAALQRVTSFHASCPRAHITLLGYSFGALIAGNTAEALAQSDDVPHNQINAVLYGDPRRALHHNGIEGRAGGYLSVMATVPGIAAAGPRDFGDVAVSENCNQNDVICNAANPLSNRRAFVAEIDGYLHGAHFYPMDPWRDAAPGDHYVPATTALDYGAPTAPWLPTPRELTHVGPIDLAGVASWPANRLLQQLDWAAALDRYGLPGRELVHLWADWSERNGVLL